MMKMGQSSYSRLLAKPFLDNKNISLLALGHELFLEIQSTGIDIFNDFLYFYFQLKEKGNGLEILPQFLGLEVTGSIQGSNQYIIHDFSPEFFYSQTVIMEKGQISYEQLEQGLISFYGELKAKNHLVKGKGRVLFQWSKWCNELEIELFVKDR